MKEGPNPVTKMKSKDKMIEELCRSVKNVNQTMLELLTRMRAVRNEEAGRVDVRRYAPGLPKHRGTMMKESPNLKTKMKSKDKEMEELRRGLKYAAQSRLEVETTLRAMLEQLMQVVQRYNFQPSRAPAPCG